MYNMQNSLYKYGTISTSKYLNFITEPLYNYIIVL